MTDVFISCGSSVSAAEEIGEKLAQAGIGCKYYPSGADIQGEEEALNDCKVFVAILSGTSNEDMIRQMKKASEREKKGEDITVLAMQISDDKTDAVTASIMAGYHWVDAVSVPLETAVKTLIEEIKPLFPEASGPMIFEKTYIPPKKQAEETDGDQPEKPKKIRSKMTIIACLLVVVSVVMIINSVRRIYSTIDPVSPAKTAADALPPLTEEQIAQGIERWESGGVYYTGHMVNGVIEGEGEGIYPEGDVYKGMYVNGLCEGHGVLTFPNGAVYDGEWANDMYNGYGVMKYENGSVYEGEWKDNKRSGHGVRTNAEGTVLDGEWSDNMPNGMGTMTSADGEEWYEGEFRDGYFDGKGIYHFKDGGWYEGEYKEDKFNGKGERHFEDGSVYIGEYIDDEKNGYGIFIYSDGNSYEGEWKDGSPCGQGTLIWDGKKFEGEFTEDGPNGHGILTTEDGREVEGEWESGTDTMTVKKDDGTVEVFEMS